MKGIRAHEIGGPEVLKYEDIPDPRPGPGQALVDIRAIGVNYTDVSSRKGTNPPASFPWTPGREAAGIVKSVGEGVTEVAVGNQWGRRQRRPGPGSSRRFSGNVLWWPKPRSRR